VLLTLVNEDPVPHDFSLYLGEDATGPIHIGEVFSGPGTAVTEEFTAPTEPGDYFFRCDVHPIDMTGTFVVA
jgi:plastocyanin